MNIIILIIWFQHIIPFFYFIKENKLNEFSLKIENYFSLFVLHTPTHHKRKSSRLAGMLCSEGSWTTSSSTVRDSDSMLSWVDCRRMCGCLTFAGNGVGRWNGNEWTFVLSDGSCINNDCSVPHNQANHLSICSASWLIFYTSKLNFIISQNWKIYVCGQSIVWEILSDQTTDNNKKRRLIHLFYHLMANVW